MRFTAFALDNMTHDVAETTSRRYVIFTEQSPEGFQRIHVTRCEIS